MELSLIWDDVLKDLVDEDNAMKVYLILEDVQSDLITDEEDEDIKDARNKLRALGEHTIAMKYL